MIYRTAPRIGVDISLFSMGGHEYLPDGRSRGFNEDMEKATRRIGYLFGGFGGERRRNVLRIAYDHGVNFFDVTQDSEKEALGRNLRDQPPPYDIYVQTRPEGLCYSYDPCNRGLADHARLRAEVVRGLTLLGRDHVDFLNFGILRWALDDDPDYLAKLADNIGRLKAEGLIRWASADTFSGQWTFLRMIECGAFDSINLNFNFGDRDALAEVVPAAKRAGMAVFVREAFMKGPLFRMGAEAGQTDRLALAQAALRWSLNAAEPTSLTIGTGNPDHLLDNLAVVENPIPTADDVAMIAAIEAKSPTFREFRQAKEKEFLGA